MATKVKTGVIDAGAITSALITDASITADDLHTTLDLTGKTVTVATASPSDNDTSVASTAYVTTAIANLADSAPSTLNTLNELAAALGDDANFSTTVTNSIATKLPLAGGTMTGELGIGVTPGAWSVNYPALQIGQGATFTGHISNTQTQLGQNWWVGTGNQYVVNGAASRLVMGTDSSITFSQAPSGTAGATMSTITNPLVINAAGNATFSGDVGMATGHSSGKFAVMATSVHGSYDFYNNGTSYFNGTVIVDDHLSVTGTSAQLTLSRTSTDQTAGFNLTNNQNGGYGSGIVWNSKRSDAGLLTAAEITVSGENSWNSDATSSSMMQFATRKDNTLTTHMTIRKTGNVGIGTTDPYGKLQIEGNTTSWATSPILIFASTSTTNAAVRDWAIGPADSNYGDFHILQGASTGASPLSTSNAKLTISAAGNVGIGTTTPNNQSRLTLALPASTNGRILSMSRAAGAYRYHLGIDSSSNFNLYDNDGTSIALQINPDGQINAQERIDVGVFPSSQTNTGEAWIGRASDRQDGTLTIQLGGDSATGTNFEIVDRAWSKVISYISGEAPEASLYVNSGGDLHFGGSNQGRIKTSANSVYIDAIPTNSHIIFRNDGSVEKMHITDTGSVYHVEQGSDGDYTSYIGSISNSGGGARYAHVNISTEGGDMFWIEVIGYDYAGGGLVYGRSGGYMYLYTTTTTVYSGHVNGSIVAHYQLTNGTYEVVVDTNRSDTSNRWGSMVFRGGTDTITATQPLEIIQYSYTGTTAKVY